jgi:hypothetical protein
MKLIPIILFLIFLYGCNSQTENQYKFVQIDDLNDDLQEKVGINIKTQKFKADSVYKLDDQFYLNLLTDISQGLNSNSFDRSNIPIEPVNLAGRSFPLASQSDSLAASMMLCFANNMIMSNCDHNNKDANCVIKQNWYGFMSGDQEAQFSYNFFLSRIGELYDKHFVTREEFHYLILYLHYLGVLQNQENRKSL